MSNKGFDFKRALSKVLDVADSSTLSDNLTNSKYRKAIDKIINNKINDEISKDNPNYGGLLIQDANTVLLEKDIDLYKKTLKLEKERNNYECSSYLLVPIGIATTLGTVAIVGATAPFMPIIAIAATAGGFISTKYQAKTRSKRIKNNLNILDEKFKPSISITRENIEKHIGISPSLDNLISIIIPPKVNDFFTDASLATKQFKKFKNFKGQNNNYWELENRNITNEQGIVEKRIYLIKK